MPVSLHIKSDCMHVCPALCQEELRKEKREREELEEEKDAAIRDLQHKLDNMESDYEKILHVSHIKLAGICSCGPACLWHILYAYRGTQIFIHKSDIGLSCLCKYFTATVKGYAARYLS